MGTQNVSITDHGHSFMQVMHVPPRPNQTLCQVISVCAGALNSPATLKGLVVREGCRDVMAAPVSHACFQSARPLKLSSRVHGSTHSCFMSGSALNTVHQQPAGTNAVRQVHRADLHEWPGSCLLHISRNSLLPRGVLTLWQNADNHDVPVSRSKA